MKLWLGVVAAALLPVGAAAENVTMAWTRFIDPTENSFAVDVPQGWTVKGGVSRLNAVIATGWVTAVSPDGTMQLFIGDPETPFFREPPQNQPEGTQLRPMTPQSRPEIALHYRAGGVFAEMYGPNHLAAVGCTGATETGQQPMPDVARLSYARSQEVVRGIHTQFAFTVPQHDAGLVTFACQSNGRPYVAGVIADTAQPVPGGSWHAGVMGYLATPEQAPLAKAILLHIFASRQWNPQWDQAMREAAQEAFDQQAQQNAQVASMLQQQSQDFTNMLLARGNAMQAQRTASHNAFMAQMQERSERRNADFAMYQARRSLNSWRFNAYIRNGQLYRNVNTGEYFEVDH